MGLLNRLIGSSDDVPSTEAGFEVTSVEGSLTLREGVSSAMEAKRWTDEYGDAALAYVRELQKNRGVSR